MANDWNATKLWTFSYLSERTGQNPIMYSSLVRKPGQSDDVKWSFAI